MMVAALTLPVFFYGTLIPPILCVDTWYSWHFHKAVQVHAAKQLDIIVEQFLDVIFLLTTYHKKN
jgi:hypothetical protein